MNVTQTHQPKRTKNTAVTTSNNTPTSRQNDVIPSHLGGEEKKVAHPLSSQVEVAPGITDKASNLPLPNPSSGPLVENIDSTLNLNLASTSTNPIYRASNETVIHRPVEQAQLGGEEMKVAPPLSPQTEVAPGTTDKAANLPLSRQVSGLPVENSENPAMTSETSQERTDRTSPNNPEANTSRRCIAIQWNVNGIRERYAELQLVTSEVQPGIIAVQETRLSQIDTLKNFQRGEYKWSIRPGPTSSTQNGVGLAVHNSLIHTFLRVNTNLQVVAARVGYPIEATYVSIYIPCHSPPNQLHAELDKLMSELPHPVVIMGDFNSHSALWGSYKNDNKGAVIEDFAAQHNLIILNTGEHTRLDPRSGRTSAIDLTIASPEIAPKLQWNVDPDNRTSDHFPVIITSSMAVPTRRCRKRWIHERADWALYEDILLERIHRSQVYTAEEISIEIINAAEQSIPRTSGKLGTKSVPWWNAEVKAAIKTRRKKLRALKRIHNDDPRKQRALEEFQQARNESRRAVTEAKKTSWDTFVSGINPQTPGSALWRKVNALRGKRSIHKPILVVDSETIEDPHQIAENLACFFESVSRSDSSESSLAEMADEITDTNHDTNINENFSVEELLWAVDRGGNTSTGADNISYQMLRRLPYRIKIQVLDAINKIWSTGTIPEPWKEGIIIPLPKPGKDPKQIGNQRPITLLSCFSKTVERMVNRRLTSHLEKYGRLNPHQFAFRKGRGVDTYFDSFESAIRQPFEEGQHCEALMIDLQKAYDKADRNAIVSTLISWGISGKMLKFIRSFLTNRRFRVSVGDALSSSKVQVTGVPQGSILSVTLFLVLMESVFVRIPRGLRIYVYADDILVLAIDKNAKQVRQNIQEAAKALGEWAEENKMSISVEKSCFIHLCKKRKHPELPPILINNIPVPEQQYVRILGLVVDRRLNFKSHTATVRRNTQNMLNLLKVVGNRINGATRKSLLQVANAVVLPKLLYGFLIVNSGSGAAIKSMQPLYNAAIRECSGVFRTSPIDAIMAESGQLPFHYRTTLHATTKAIRLQERYGKIFPTNASASYSPTIERAFEEYQKLTGQQLPRIASVLRIGERSWNETPPKIDWCIKSEFRVGNAPSQAQQLFLAACESKYWNSTHIFTDGSVSDQAVGFGISCENTEISKQLPQACSIFSAEAMAILYTIKYICTENTESVIFTDSASVLQALENGESRHPWIQAIEFESRRKAVTLCWIPGHVNIKGNERADQLAKAARPEDLFQCDVPSEDVIRNCRIHVELQWEAEWRRSTSFLRSIKSSTTKWPDRGSATERRAISRLRIGHTRLTHQHIFTKEDNICRTCGVSITVQHILLDCRQFEDLRKKYQLKPTIYEILSPSEIEEKKLAQFLVETNLIKAL